MKSGAIVGGAALHKIANWRIFKIVCLRNFAMERTTDRNNKWAGKVEGTLKATMVE